MTTRTVPSATDHLRYLSHEVNQALEAAQDIIAGNCYEQHRPADQHAADLDHVLKLLDACRDTITEAVAAVTADQADRDRYSDGRPVQTRIELETGCYYCHDWHPDPEHPSSQPQDIGTVTLRDGSRKRVLIAAPGVLDAVPTTPHLRVIRATGAHC
ncbi:hypothetical protein CKJ65_16450 [Mycobacterium intracellulare]|uniref:hypothetical protein n=1 Tax=Mycobacterium intracellulare TaxID=1767 RepID=UPI000BAFAF93|nr:hypothetical protein [Mycobacterium intracellulare]PBA30570.1 hypothetical protein CKJ65_16450 [Mycobacterium intracellulare]